MELAAAATLWACISGVLLLPLLGAPRALGQAAAGLLSAELAALLAWSYGSEGCVARPCGAFAETARSAASLDVPALTAVLVVVATAHGMRAARRRAA
jgi:hypothetical protein